MVGSTYASYTIEGDKVFIDDSKAYISATPHTLSSSGWVEFNLTSKTYTGNIDLSLGFNTSEVRPTRAQLYNPSWNNTTVEHNETWTNVLDLSVPTGNYSCDVGYSHNSIHRNATISMNLNGTDTNSSMIACFDSFDNLGNNSYNIIYNQQVNTYTEWKDYTNFNSLTYSYDNLDKWWYVTNVPFTANQTRIFRVWVEVPINTIPTGKYGFALKPSSQSMSQAISAGNFYYLDPWWNSTWTKKQEMNLTHSTSLTDFETLVKVTYDSDMQSDFDDIRFLNGAEDTELPFCILNKTDSTEMYVRVKADSNSTGVINYMYYGNPTASSGEDCQATYLFWDDFESGSINATKWTTDAQDGSVVNITNGKLYMYNQGGSGFNREVWAYGNVFVNAASGDYIFETSSFWATAQQYNYPAVGWDNGTAINQVNGGDNAYLWNHENQWKYRAMDDFVFTDQTLSITAPVSVQIVWNSTSEIYYYLNNSNVFRLTTNIPDDDMTAFMKSHHHNLQTTSPQETLMEDVLIRNYALVEPEANFGSEEEETEPNNAPQYFEDFTNNTYQSTQAKNITLWFTDDLDSNVTVDLYLNDVLNLTNDTVFNNTNTTFEITGLSEGNHTYYLNVTDSSNSSNNTDFYTIVVDLTSPVIILNSPTNNSYHSGNIDVDLSITEINFESAVWSEDGFTTNTSLSTPYDFTVTVSAEETKIISVWVNDLANNTNSTIYHFRIDLTNPSVTNINSDPSCVEVGGGVTILWDQSDSGSGLASSLCNYTSLYQLDISNGVGSTGSCYRTFNESGTWEYYINVTDSVGLSNSFSANLEVKTDGGCSTGGSGGGQDPVEEVEENETIILPVATITPTITQQLSAFVVQQKTLLISAGLIFGFLGLASRFGWI